MKVSGTILLLAAALGVSAHPSGHGHQHAHRSAAKRDFVMNKKPIPLPSTTAEPTVAAPTTSSKPAPASSSAAAGGGNGQGAGGVVPFCGSNSKRATAAEIAYKGNTGTADNFGCNMMLVQKSVADSYDYTVAFTNAASDEQECVCFNKIGRTGGINGFFKGNEAVTFKLAPGAEQVVAFDSNTQGGCSCGSGSVPLTSFGEFAATWLELDMANESNGGHSGADASCLVSAKYGLDIPGLKVCGSDMCSTINPGGTGTNAYLGGMEAEDGIGLNLEPGKVRLEVIVGYSG